MAKFSGCNDDTYKNQGKIWEIAKRSNMRQKIVRKRVVKDVELIGIR